jgi:hypothetical protein
MITQIQRCRRFLVWSSGGCPGLERETDKGWSIAFFFSYVRVRTLNSIESFSHIRDGGLGVQIVHHVPGTVDCGGAFVLACLLIVLARLQPNPGRAAAV